MRMYLKFLKKNGVVLRNLKKIDTGQWLESVLKKVVFIEIITKWRKRTVTLEEKSETEPTTVLSLFID